MPALSDALGLLDRDRAAFLAAYDALTPEQRGWRPGGASWSADDVAEHLVRSEAGSLRIVGKQAAAGKASRDLGAPDDAKLARLEEQLRSEGRWTMPKAIAEHIAPAGADGEASRAQIAEMGTAWHAVAETFPEALETVALLSHAVGGPLTAAGTLRFVAAHIEHHTRQLGRIRADAGFPKAG